MKNKLTQYFFTFIACIFAFVLLFVLFGPKGEKISLEEISFSTLESNEIYYKNLRSFYYNIEEREDAQFKLYRIKSREKDSLKNKLNFVLVMNWRFDECYILCESYALKTDLSSAPLYIIASQKEQKDTLSLKEYNSHSQYIFAAQLYEKLTEGSQLYLQVNNELLPFSEEEKTSLQTSLKDYFKLVGMLR